MKVPANKKHLRRTKEVERWGNESVFCLWSTEESNWTKLIFFCSFSFCFFSDCHHEAAAHCASLHGYTMIKGWPFCIDALWSHPVIVSDDEETPFQMWWMWMRLHSTLVCRACRCLNSCDWISLRTASWMEIHLSVMTLKGGFCSSSWWFVVLAASLWRFWIISLCFSESGSDVTLVSTSELSVQLRNTDVSVCPPVPTSVAQDFTAVEKGGWGAVPRPPPLYGSIW